MAKKKSIRTKPADKPKPSVERDEQLPERNEELCQRKDIETACLEVYKDVEAGFQNQWERANAQMDYWDIYNCELGPKQFYSGNSKIFVPIVSDAVDARKTRFINQIFPPSGRNVEVITSENKPYALMALLEFYIRKAKLRTVCVPALMKNGDIEGQYNIYMSWTENERHVAWRVKRKPTVDAPPGVDSMEEDGEPVELPDDDEEFDDIEEATIVHAYPSVEVLPDADVLILPLTASTSDEAIDAGGSVTVIRRWSKSKIEEMIKDGELDEERGEALLEQFTTKQPGQTPDKKSKMVDAAGIKTEGSKQTAYCYETWTKLTLMEEDDDGERVAVRRICRIRFGGESSVLSCKRNPYWCDHVPLISAPSNRAEGSVKGRSRIRKIETLQYAANDAVNEGMDSAAYALLPIVMTDPLKNPKIGTMILNVAAVWETSPTDTQFAKFPELWKGAFEIVNACKAQIQQSLGVNPAMIPQGSQSSKGKMNQAQVAAEQQVDILTTADVVTEIEGDILTPILRWFVYLDHQYRTDPLMVRQFGQMGVEVEMQTIEPVQMDRRFEVKWFGVEAARNAQQQQLRISGINVVRGIPPQSYLGYELNLAPVISQFIEDLFGPRLSSQIFQDVRKRLTLDAQFENQILVGGMQLPVNPMDNDQEHMQAHMKAFQEFGDTSGALREHLMLHNMQLQKKAQQAQQQPGQPGAPGGGQDPGMAGTPRQGAMAGQQRNGQAPPGAIHQDRMQDPGAAPRAGGQR